jgi:hypothetical protein
MLINNIGVKIVSAIPIDVQLKRKLNPSRNSEYPLVTDLTRNAKRVYYKLQRAFNESSIGKK